MNNHIYNHYRKIAHKQYTILNQLLPGMMVEFRYRGEEVHDKKPLTLFIFHDKSKKLVHGINLNYLTDRKIQELFKMFKKRTLIENTSESRFFDDKYTRTFISNWRKYGSITAKDLYYKIIKPKLLINHDVYRTYTDSGIKSPRIITYRLDFIKMRGKIK